MARVLLYARVNPADEGGVQAVVNRLAAHLRSRGHAVTKVWGMPAPPGLGEPSWVLPPLIMRGRLPAPRSGVWAAGALGRLAARLARLRPDVVNVHYVTGEAIYFALLKRLFRYRLVLSFHGSDVLRTQAPDAPLLPRIAAGADVLTAVSQLAAARVGALPGAGGARVHVVPNGVDYGFWSARPHEPGPGPPLVLSVGRLDPVKGHDVLLGAWPRVLARHPEARLVIVGDGGFRGALEQAARALGIAASVEFTGQLDAAGVRAWMARARAFVLPSRSEGLPLALLEAMAAGVPAIATAAGGSPEVLTGGSGLLVPPEDPDALGQALAELLAAPSAAAALACRGRERAAGFSAAAVHETYEALLLGGSGRAGDGP